MPRRPDPLAPPRSPALCAGAVGSAAAGAAAAIPDERCQLGRQPAGRGLHQVERQRVVGRAAVVRVRDITVVRIAARPGRDPYDGDVPDPYDGSAADYALAFDLVQAAASGLAAQLAALIGDGGSGAGGSGADSAGAEGR